MTYRALRDVSGFGGLSVITLDMRRTRAIRDTVTGFWHMLGELSYCMNCFFFELASERVQKGLRDFVMILNCLQICSIFETSSDNTGYFPSSKITVLK